MKVLKTIGLYFGALVGLCSLILAVTAGVQVATGRHPGASSAAMILTAGLFLVAAAVGIAPSVVVVHRRVHSGRDLEAEVLKAAASHRGKLTVAEVAASGEIPIKKAEAALAEASRKGLCNIEITGSGTLVYVFEGFLTDEERRTTKDPLR